MTWIAAGLGVSVGLAGAWLALLYWLSRDNWHSPEVRI